MGEETGWFPGQDAEPQSAREHTPRATDPDVGVVRDLQQRTESRGSGGDASSDQVLTFRVERFDAAGNRRPAIAVEMRGEALWGVVSEGNWVQIPPDWTPGRPVQASELHNVTTDSQFGVTSRPHAYPQAVMVCVMLTGFAIFLIGFATSTRTGPSPLAFAGLALAVGSVLVYAFIEVIRKSISRGRRPGPRRSLPRPVRVGATAVAALGTFALGVEIASAAGLSGWLR